MTAEDKEVVNYIKYAFDLREQGCYKKAIEMLYKALETEPDNIEILFQVGELYYLLHNYSRAFQYAEKILSRQGNHLPALNLLKNIYLRQGEIISAKEIAEKMYEIDASEENLAVLIEICGRLELFDDIEKYDTQIQKSDRCLFEYANSYYKISNLDKSEEILKKAFSVNPENSDCGILKGKILFDKNELKKSKEFFDKFGRNSQDPQVLNYQGLFAMEDLDFIGAIKNFSKASNIDSQNPVYFYNLGNADFLNGWHEEAVTAYKKAIHLAPENLDYRYSLAYLYFGRKEFDKAKKEIDFILEDNGKYYDAKVLQALLHLERKEFLESEKILLSNLKDGQDDNFTLSALAKTETEIAKFDSAEKHLKTVLERSPENLDCKCNLGDIYIKEKKYDLAVQTAEEVINKNGNYVHAYILGAKASYLKGDYEQTKDFAQKALSVDINCADGYFYLAMVRLNEKDYEEAIECMKRAITFDVNNACYYAKMAEIYKLSGDNKTAFEYVKEAESIDSSEEYKILYREFASLNRR